MRTATRLGYALGLPALLVVLWWVLTLGPSSIFVPEPGPLLSTFVDVWLGDRLLADVLPSAARLLLGLALAIVLGVGLGLLVGSVRPLRQVLEPLLEFLRSVPPTILVPVLLLLIGINDAMKVVVIVTGCVWPILLNTVEGVRGMDPVMRDTATSFHVTGWRRLTRLVFPSASPQIMVGIRQSLSIGLILMVVSEMFAASSGLGFAITQFQRSFAIQPMWSGIALLGLLGVALAAVFRLAERRILGWYHGMREAGDDH